MKLKITSNHKIEGNVSVNNILIPINEFYINTTSNTVTIRCNPYVIGEDENIYPIKLLASDPLQSCISQQRSIDEWKNSTENVSFNDTKYNILATLLFGLITDSIELYNTTSENKITYIFVD